MKNFGNQLLTKVRKIVRSYCKAATDQIKQQWTAVNNIDGEARVRQEDLPIAQDAIARAIVATGQKAWIAEYGKGSLMNDVSENPFLQDYINSPLFNRLRKTAFGATLSVVGREEGEYPLIDGGTGYSHGLLAGKELETWKGQPLYPPISGKHIIKHTLDDLIPQMEEEIQEACADTLMELLARFPKEIKIAK